MFQKIADRKWEPCFESLMDKAADREAWTSPFICYTQDTIDPLPMKVIYLLFSINSAYTVC